jgi:hypothetical protein
MRPIFQMIDKQQLKQWAIALEQELEKHRRQSKDVAELWKPITGRFAGACRSRIQVSTLQSRTLWCMGTAKVLILPLGKWQIIHHWNLLLRRGRAFGQFRKKMLTLPGEIVEQ